MLILPHSTVGLLIGTVVKNPVLSFFLAWLSHYILDFIPHSDAGYFKDRGENWLKNKLAIAWVFLDAVLSVIVLGLVIAKNGLDLNLLAGYCGSLGPDVLDNSPLWSETIRKIPVIKWEYKRVHNNFHNTITNTRVFIGGIIISYTISVILLYWLLR